MIICAVTYVLLVGVALAGGRTALLMGLLLLLGLLHACLTGLARTAVTPAMSIRKPTVTPVGTRAAKN